MTTNNSKNQHYVIFISLVILLLLLVKIIMEVNIIDIIYLCVIVAYLIRYLLIGKETVIN